jgi:hypothetical protein
MRFGQVREVGNCRALPFGCVRHSSADRGPRLWTQMDTEMDPEFCFSIKGETDTTQVKSARQQAKTSWWSSQPAGMKCAKRSVERHLSSAPEVWFASLRFGMVR